MLKNKSIQLEMFSDERPDAHLGRASSKNCDPQYLNKIHEYRKIVISLIVVIFISIVSFSVGVERGKKAAVIAGSSSVSQEYNPSQDNTVATTGQNLPSPSVTAAGIGVGAGQIKKLAPNEGVSIRDDKKEKPKAKDANDIKEGYTIQVASILKAENAIKELGKLKTKGYSAFSLAKGKYTVICIGKFSIKEDARGYQQKLKSSYPDCQIRRL